MDKKEFNETRWHPGMKAAWEDGEYLITAVDFRAGEVELEFLIGHTWVDYGEIELVNIGEKMWKKQQH